MGKTKKKMATYKLPPDVLAELKAFAVVMERQQGEVVAEAVKQYLKREIPRTRRTKLIKELADTYRQRG